MEREGGPKRSYRRQDQGNKRRALFKSKQEGGGEDWGPLENRDMDWGPLEADNDHEDVLEAGDEDEDVGVLGARRRRRSGGLWRG